MDLSGDSPLKHGDQFAIDLQRGHIQPLTDSTQIDDLQTGTETGAQRPGYLSDQGVVVGQRSGQGTAAGSAVWPGHSGRVSGLAKPQQLD